MNDELQGDSREYKEAAKMYNHDLKEYYRQNRSQIKSEEEQESISTPQTENIIAVEASDLTNEQMSQALACGIAYRDGIFYGTYDELVSAGLAPFGYDYTEERDKRRRLSKAAEEQYPLTYAACQMAGFLSNPATYFASPALVGAVNGWGNSEADTLLGIAGDTALGSATAIMADKSTKLLGKRGRFLNNKYHLTSKIPSPISHTFTTLVQKGRGNKAMNKVIDFSPKVGYNATSYVIDAGLQSFLRDELGVDMLYLMEDS